MKLKIFDTFEEALEFMDSNRNGISDSEYEESRRKVLKDSAIKFNGYNIIVDDQDLLG